MYKKKQRKAFALRTISALMLLTAVLARIILGTGNTNMLIFATFGGVMVYAIVAACSLFPSDWKTRCFEPAREDTHSVGFDEIQDKLQLKIAFGWMNVFIMLCISMGIFFGCK